MLTRLPAGLGIGFSVFTTVLLALEIAFNVYAIALKETFNFTQTEVEMISSAGLAGMGASLSESFVTRRFGYRAGYLVIWSMTSGSALLMWLAVVYRHKLKFAALIVAIIQFLMSVSQNAGSTRLTSITLLKVETRHTGTFVSVYSAAIALAQLFYGCVFLFIFKKNLEGFMLAVGLSHAVSIAVCFFTHWPVEVEKKPPGPDNNNTIALPDETTGMIQKTEKKEDNDSFSYMLASKDFHLLFWPTVVSYAIMFTFMNNVTFIASSVGLAVPIHQVFVLSAVVVTGRLLFGKLFDRVTWRHCGVVILVVGYMSAIFGLIVLVTFLGPITIYFVTVLFGVGISVGITIPCSLLSIRFGQQYFQYIIGCFYCLTAILCLIFQFFVGHIYDRFSNSNGFCKGAHCFYLASIVFLSVSLFCLIALLIGRLIQVNFSDKTQYQKIETP